MNHLNVHTVAEQLATDDEQLTEPMREEAFSLQVMRFAPGDEDPMHAHDEEEIYFIDAGTATLVTEDESVTVEPGDVVHLSPGTEHQFTDFEGTFVTTVVYAPAETAHDAH